MKIDTQVEHSSSLYDYFLSNQGNHVKRMRYLNLCRRVLYEVFKGSDVVDESLIDEYFTKRKLGEGSYHDSYLLTSFYEEHNGLQIVLLISKKPMKDGVQPEVVCEQISSNLTEKNYYPYGVLVYRRGYVERKEEGKINRYSAVFTEMAASDYDHLPSVLTENFKQNKEYICILSIFQCLEALYYLKQAGSVSHQDLYPRNILWALKEPSSESHVIGDTIHYIANPGFTIRLWDFDLCSFSGIPNSKESGQQEQFQCQDLISGDLNHVIRYPISRSLRDVISVISEFIEFAKENRIEKVEKWLRSYIPKLCSRSNNNVWGSVEEIGDLINELFSPTFLNKSSMSWFQSFPIQNDPGYQVKEAMKPRPISFSVDMKNIPDFDLSVSMPNVIKIL